MNSSINVRKSGLFITLGFFVVLFTLVLTYQYTSILVFAASPPKGSLSAPTVIKAGDDGRFTATAQGEDLTKIGIYRARPGAGRFLQGEEIWENGIIREDSCNGETCSLTASWEPSPPDEYGPWYVVVRVYDKNGLKCSGNPSSDNPWTSLQGNTWYKCGSDDLKEVQAEPPDPSKKKDDRGKGKSKPAISPTPTPIQYSCTYNPQCDKSNPNTLQLCTLICVSLAPRR